MNKQSQNLIIIGVIIVIVLIIFGGRMFYKLEATERGVVFRQFTTGLDKDNILLPGFQVIAPWNDLYIYDVSEQKIEESMDVLDKNGLSINIDVTVRFYPTYTKVGYLYESFRLKYADLLVGPEIRSAVRQITGRYTAEEIYSTKRAEVEQTIIEESGKQLKANNITMKALLIRSINLPPDIRKAIETKLVEEQQALAYQYKLNREKSEAERKRIGAEGEARANKIINSSLTTSLLKMRGIEATLELGKSENTKIIVIGGGEDGMPLIMNAD